MVLDGWQDGLTGQEQWAEALLLKLPVFRPQHRPSFLEQKWSAMVRRVQALLAKLKKEWQNDNKSVKRQALLDKPKWKDTLFLTTGIITFSIK